METAARFAAFGKLERAFEDLERRWGSDLVALYQAGGWGRSEREVLEQLSRPDCDPNLRARLEKIRRALEDQAAAPAWWLRAASGAQKEWRAFANQAAALAGHTGPDGWLVWLDWIAAGFSDEDRAGTPIVLNACALSAQYCRSLAAGPAVGSALAVSAEPSAPAINEPVEAINRSNAVRDYMRAVENETGASMTKAMIYRVAKVDRSEFQRWQRDDQKRPASASARRRIEQVLRNKPHLSMKE
jgi:hypothetical protein